MSPSLPLLWANSPLHVQGNSNVTFSFLNLNILGLYLSNLAKLNVTSFMNISEYFLSHCYLLILKAGTNGDRLDFNY